MINIIKNTNPLRKKRGFFVDIVLDFSYYNLYEKND
jgi:hypothetical protein